MKLFTFFPILCLYGLSALSQTQSDFLQKEIIYGRKDGLALTLHLLAPKTGSNGKAIIFIVSGGWYSMEEWIPDYISNSQTFLQRGYTVFLVKPSSRPMFTILDGIADAQRAVRFIRYHAKEYRIDPHHMGITGKSSGGQLSLAVATEDAVTDSSSADPVDRVSSRVQAVACFYPPSDFLNWGNMKVDTKNKMILDQADIYSAFEFKEWDPKHKHFAIITDEQKLNALYREVSPFYQISPDDPPILIAHGTADVIVPFSQSVRFMEKLRQTNVTCQLLVKEGAGHGGWKDEVFYEKAFADWFDKYL